jgi:hypothetical protein
VTEGEVVKSRKGRCVYKHLQTNSLRKGAVNRISTDCYKNANLSDCEMFRRERKESASSRYETRFVRAAIFEDRQHFFLQQISQNYLRTIPSWEVGSYNYKQFGSSFCAQTGVARLQHVLKKQTSPHP